MSTKYKKFPSLWRWKSHSYNWFFFALALGIAAYTELFYHHRPSEKILTSEHDGLPQLRAESINSILLQNKVHMIRLTKDGPGNWFSHNVEKNTKIPIKEEFINGLVSTISSLNMQKSFANDSLNRANFSLNEPLATLTVSTQDGRSYRMKIGISNPISKSSYITINDSPKIFQIDMISNRVLSFHQENIFDDRIFSFTLNKLASLHFTWPGLGQKSIILDKDQQKWLNAQNVEISSDNINGLLKILRNIKSAKIIHPQSDESGYKQLLGTFNQPLFKIEVSFTDEKYNYIGTKGYQREIASLIKSNEYYLVKEVNRNEILVMNKDDFSSITNFLKIIK
jgi:hypothetical protein